MTLMSCAADEATNGGCDEGGCVFTDGSKVRDGRLQPPGDTERQ